MGAMTRLSPGRTPRCGMFPGEDPPGPRTLQAPWHQRAAPEPWQREGRPARVLGNLENLHLPATPPECSWVGAFIVLKPWRSVADGVYGMSLSNQ